MVQTDESSFEINIHIAGSSRRLTVSPQETTDGAPYYVCLENQNQIAEVRKESNGDWVQLWGDLDEQSITAIGQAIDKKTP
jgi:hypothetical protein